MDATGLSIPEDTATRFETLAREFDLPGADLVGTLVAWVVGVDADLRRARLHGRHGPDGGEGAANGRAADAGLRSNTDPAQLSRS